MSVPYVLVFTREAGGAETLAPVLKQLGKKLSLLIVASQHARERFDRHGIVYHSLPDHSEEAFERLCVKERGGLPKVLFTSATSMPFIDMTERHLWMWAKKRGIPSVAVLDQWNNYALRFSGPGKGEYLKYFPDVVAIMDEFALRDMKEEGIPENLLRITGHPALEDLVKSREYLLTMRAGIRERLNVGSDTKLILFASECIGRDFHDEFGFDEKVTFDMTLASLKNISAETGMRLHLGIKLHPENVIEDIGDGETEIASAASPVVISVHRSEIPYRQLIVAADIVVGMVSMLLVESAVLGVPVVSVQPNATPKARLVLTAQKLIPRIERQDELDLLMKELLSNARQIELYLARQGRFQTHSGATANIERLVVDVFRGKGA